MVDGDARRGSEQLLGRCEPLSRDTLAKLGDLVQEHGARLVGWECFGQPRPEIVRGVVHAEELDSALELVRGVLELDRRFTAEVFPIGIPPFPELFETHFGTRLPSR